MGRLARIAAAVDAAMPQLRTTAATKSWKRTSERDLQDAVESSSGTSSAAANLRCWPKVGRFDLCFDGVDAAELKWAKSGDTLGNCMGHCEAGCSAC
jgi:hypothetical protein